MELFCQAVDLYILFGSVVNFNLLWPDVAPV